ncbi:hypothetical protein LEP1GSC196_2122 [Leptospira meyeri serovar Semaranga str. Veldrot Semarang 173]|nr:hypothetical protein LEP1GSC196_2122 [Leptospira meyeri serovar Semaranga str. Veldrot Semarang 173]
MWLMAPSATSSKLLNPKFLTMIAAKSFLFCMAEYTTRLIFFTALVYNFFPKTKTI